MSTGGPLVLGTAGHVDHGKTALVLALTGRDTDRLPEEKARGISIALGFAPLDLGDGRAVSLVDVPGHERFVRHMVAGASGIDGYLLCVAADDGVMPQTLEHLAVLRLLGVADGVVAVTKSDLIEPELAVDEVRELVGGGPEVIAVSSVTGDGIDALRDALRRLAGRLARRTAWGKPRLFVDRVFSVAGAGTVATGTLWGGALTTGDRVQIIPGDAEARIRSVQAHDVPVEVAVGGRVAVNLVGIERDQAPRGA
jgi:selenocysteine-specific elongation factor